MRITKKTDLFIGTTVSMPKAIECYWKVKDYEDLEEELGINLIIFTKAMLNGVYVKSCRMFVSLLDYIIDIEAKCFVPCTDNWEEILYFKDYGKAWALTKEELL